MIAKRILVFAVSILAAAAAYAQFPYALAAPGARDAFRNGVVAYNAGRYPESLMLFEQARAAEPADPLVSFWLGKAYYRAGANASAFALWREALASGGPAPFLSARLELFSLADDPQALAPADRFVRFGELAGVQGRNRLFLRPSWVEPLPDGGALMVAYGTNEILRVGINGTITQRMNGGSAGFDRPFAVQPWPGGGYIVSEFQANRLARLGPDGRVLGYIGESSGPGRMAGPQYLALDADGFIYVSDVGFSRVAKFDPDGRFVTSIGARSVDFPGFAMPTGVAIRGDELYVADAARRTIYRFDLYGNYRSSLGEGALRRPEGLRSVEGGLLVADTGRILFVDGAYGSVQELYRPERPNARVTSAAFDVNGDLLFVDFDHSELAFLSDPAQRYAGLSVDVIRAHQGSYPAVSLDVLVRDKAGRPVVGLEQSNFYLSQTVRELSQTTVDGRPVTAIRDTTRPAEGYAFGGALDLVGDIDAVFLVEASPALMAQRIQVRAAMTELYQAIGSGSASLVMAQAVAQPALRGGLAQISGALMAARADQAWRFDAGLRLAVGSLAQSDRRRVIFYLTTGSANEELLGAYSPAELASLLSANGVAFYPVVIGRGATVSDTIRLLTERTGGRATMADRPEGLAPIVEEARRRSTGIYRLSFNAAGDDGFGLHYMPVAVELYLRGRSGRDETGFFAPLR